MYRNLMNRWWAIALACVLGCVLLVSAPSRGVAGSVIPTPSGLDPGNPQDPGTNSAGDPDIPTNTGRSAPVVSHGKTTVGSMHKAPSAMDEAALARNMWVLRIRFALQAVKVFYLRD